MISQEDKRKLIEIFIECQQELGRLQKDFDLLGNKLADLINKIEHAIKE